MQLAQVNTDLPRCTARAVSEEVDLFFFWGGGGGSQALSATHCLRQSAGGLGKPSCFHSDSPLCKRSKLNLFKRSLLQRASVSFRSSAKTSHYSHQTCLNHDLSPRGDSKPCTLSQSREYKLLVERSPRLTLFPTAGVRLAHLFFKDI
jgi:hypothetical protein